MTIMTAPHPKFTAYAFASVMLVTEAIVFTCIVVPALIIGMPLLYIASLFIKSDISRSRER